MYPVRTPDEFMRHMEDLDVFQLEDRNAELLDEDDFGLPEKAKAIAEATGSDPLQTLMSVGQEWSRTVNDKDSIDKRARA